MIGTAFLVLVFFWLLPPSLWLIGIVLRLGPRAPVETTIGYGPAAPIGFNFESDHLYWCPIGMVGVEIQLLGGDE